MGPDNKNNSHELFFNDFNFCKLVSAVSNIIGNLADHYESFKKFNWQPREKMRACEEMLIVWYNKKLRIGLKRKLANFELYHIKTKCIFEAGQGLGHKSLTSKHAMSLTYFISRPFSSLNILKINR